MNFGINLYFLSYHIVSFQTYLIVSYYCYFIFFCVCVFCAGTYLCKNLISSLKIEKYDIQKVLFTFPALSHLLPVLILCPYC